MSSPTSQEEILLDTESPPLFNYLRQAIPIEDIRDYASIKRIDSIDVIKGFAIIFIMMAHTAEAWLNENWLYVYGMMFAVMDILGPSLFIFLSALSVVFSIKKKKGKVHPKIIRNQVFSRGASIAIIGMLLNLMGLNQGPEEYRPLFPLNLWGWNILMFLGFSQIFSYYALKLSKKWRAIIGLVIIFISMPLREVLFLGKDDNTIIWIFHFIITSPAPQLPLFPWLSICFLSTIFGEYLYDAFVEGTKDAYIGLFRIFLFWGFVFLIFGIFMPCINFEPSISITWGWQLQTPDTMNTNEYLQLQLLEIMNQQNYYKFPGIPSFLIRGTGPNMLYNLGAALLIISFWFYIMDIKKCDNNFTQMLIYYGKVSLSLFLVHMIFIALFVGQFNIVIALIVIFSYVGFMGFFMYIWNEYAKGVGSPEWIMIQISRVGQKTGETVKKEIEKTEQFIVYETKKIVSKIKKKPIQKMDNFIREWNLRKIEKKRAKIERKKLKKLHRKMGYDEDKD